MRLVLQRFIGITDDRRIILRAQNLFDAEQEFAKKRVGRIGDDDTYCPRALGRQAARRALGRYLSS